MGAPLPTNTHTHVHHPKDIVAGSYLRFLKMLYKFSLLLLFAVGDNDQEIR